MKLETLKGTKDYPPKDKALRDEIVGKLRKTFEKFGFNPLETPLIEKLDVLSAKYTGGSEILKETYKLKDQGNRELGLRYDLTVPFARFIGMNPTIKLPFKRYQIGPVFRDGPIKPGRLRQFYQCDVDIVGSKSMLADAECVKVVLDAFSELGLDVIIKVNNRKLLNALIAKADISDNKANEAILSLDKLEKVGKDGVLKELQTKGIDGTDLLNLVDKATLESLEKEFADDIGLKEIKELLEFTDDKRVVFTPSLARGLAYYTGTVFEVFAKELDSSVAGGGRYDNMITELLGRGDYPAVGISFGVEAIFEILKSKAKEQSIAKVLVVSIKQRKAADQVTAALRKAGINTDTDVSDRGVSKNLDYANSYKIPFVLIIGEKEVKQNKFTLRNMTSGKEELVTIEGTISRVGSN